MRIFDLKTVRTVDKTNYRDSIGRATNPQVGVVDFTARNRRAESGWRSKSIHHLAYCRAKMAARSSYWLVVIAASTRRAKAPAGVRPWECSSGQQLLAQLLLAIKRSEIFFLLFIKLERLRMPISYSRLLVPRLRQYEIVFCSDAEDISGTGRNLVRASTIQFLQAALAKFSPHQE